MVEGLKNDAGKPMLDLLDTEWLEGVGRILTFGARKYNANNWRAGISYSRVIAACLRHLFSFIRGDDLDKETGESHLLHASCCLMFLYWYTLHRRSFDDRFKEASDGTLD